MKKTIKKVIRAAKAVRKKKTTVASPVVAPGVLNAVVAHVAVKVTETKSAEPKDLKPLVFSQNVLLGGDPEFFFSKDGEIIGSEKVLSNDGTTIPGSDQMERYHPDNVTHNTFVIDGVQAELHPRPASCRALLGNDIANCFRQLDALMKKKGVTANFDQNVEVSQKEMDTLSDKNKVFGCAPSLNAYGESKITVDPKVFRGRSAGGHIHIGNGFQQYLTNPQQREQYRAAWEISQDPNNMWATACRLEKALKSSDIMVPVLDIVVGNTCVLIDRNPSNIERRKVYGKAGEHRIKDYGIEYRVLSNFWLRSYQLVSFVTGLCRFTVHLVEQSTEGNDYVKALFNAVTRDDVIKAINNNDFDLALKNFRAIIPIIEQAGGTYDQSYPLTKNYIHSFLYFVSKGVDHWFEKDVMKHWVSAPEGHGTGWEAFLSGRVFKEFRNSMEKEKFNLNSPKPPANWNDPVANKKHQDDCAAYNKAYAESMDPKRYVCMEVTDPSVKRKEPPVVALEADVVLA